MKNWLCSTVFAATLLFISCTVMSQTPKPINLPSHLQSVEEAVKNNTMVAVATLVRNGQMNPSSVGIDIYTFVTFRIGQTLMGDEHQEIVATFRRRTAPLSVAEIAPSVGEKYIIFFQHGPHNYPGQTYTISKFLPYNEVESTKIKASLISTETPAK